MTLLLAASACALDNPAFVEPGALADALGPALSPSAASNSR